MSHKRIFITGASGCIGHYIVEFLIQNTHHELYLLVRNPDKLKVEERCASTSNRNYEGRQGAGGRTHLVSPKMAAAAALYGKFVDIRNL